jgi:S-layer homology domain
MRFLLPIAGALLVSSTVFAQANPLLRPFKDVPPSHPNSEAILFLQANGIVQGRADGTFWPESSINRAEFTKIIVESVAKQEVIETCLSDNPTLFTDVPKTEWFAKYVCVAKKFGMAYGNPNGTYRPAYAINFAEAATLIARNLNLHTDVPQPVTLWYKPYVEALAAKSAIPQTITHLAEPITRAEMAEIIYRIKAGIPPKPSQTYEILAELSKQPLVINTPVAPNTSSSSAR